MRTSPLSKRRVIGPPEKLKAVLCIAACLVAFAALPISAAPKSAWTIMVYMNAKNNLEADGLQNFLEMASLPNSPNTNVIVEMGRPADHITTDYGGWSGVRIFYMRKGLTPDSEKAALDLTKEHLDDMGSTKPLERLVVWSQQHYPADHYMLIIWNHGQGWRFQRSLDRAVRLASATRGNGLAAEKANSNLPPPPAFYKSISFDQDTKNFLYNRDIQETLKRLQPEVPLDVIGFDACLMSMIETAYAMREVAKVMVASEELEPGAGWPYIKWLSKLSANTPTSPNKLAQNVVLDYQGKYGDFYKTTLTAIDLSKVSEFAVKFSSLSTLIKDHIDIEATNMKQVRIGIRNYGEDARLHNSIDLGIFLERYAATTKDKRVGDLALGLKRSIDNLVIQNYASSRMKGNYGSNGLAIYFPLDKQRFEEDKPDNQGYDPNAHDAHAVEFVEKEKWPLLLQAYLNH